MVMSHTSDFSLIVREVKGLIQIRGSATCFHGKFVGSLQVMVINMKYAQ